MSQNITNPDSALELHEAINKDEQLRELYQRKIQYYQRTFPTVVIDADGTANIVYDENIPNMVEIDSMIKNRMNQIIDFYNR